MNVEIGTEAAQFPEKEYINGIFIAVYRLSQGFLKFSTSPFWFSICFFYRGALKLSKPIRRLILRIQHFNYSMFSHFGYDTLQPSKSLSSRSNLPGYLFNILPGQLSLQIFVLCAEPAVHCGLRCLIFPVLLLVFHWRLHCWQPEAPPVSRLAIIGAICTPADPQWRHRFHLLITGSSADRQKRSRWEELQFCWNSRITCQTGDHLWRHFSPCWSLVMLPIFVQLVPIAILFA